MHRRIALLCVAALLGGPAMAHGGRTNADGCHHDRKNGGYHCHGTPQARTPQRAAPTPRQPLRPQTSNPAASGVYYRNCDEARAAGVAPIRRGQPGYAPHLDRDNDGIACEPYRGR